MASDPTRPMTRELLSKYLSGDALAARRLFEDHRSALLSIARQRLAASPLGADLSADDLVAEVFLRALDHGVFERFIDQGRGSLGRLLADILRKVEIDLVRRRSAAKRGKGLSPKGGVPGADDEASAGNFAAPDPTPTSDARMAEMVALCESTLDADAWRAFRLCVLDGLSKAECARRLGLSEAAVRSIIHRARQKLIQALGEREDESGADSEGRELEEGGR